MSDVTDPFDQIYHKQGELLSLIGFNDLEIFKGMHAVWNFQPLVEKIVRGVIVKSINVFFIQLFHICKYRCVSLGKT